MIKLLPMAMTAALTKATLTTASLASGSIATDAIAQPVAAAHVDVLAKSTAAWNGKRYERYPQGQPELTVLKMTIPAHTTLPWHIHPYPNAGYVLQGELTIEDRASGQKRTFHAGEAFTETVDAVHRSASGSTPTVLIITYSGTPGVPTIMPAPDEKTGH